jgi:HAD superfamily hydrolase (TIGR01490 family)
MRLVLFDLDNTLLTGDTDVEWLNFLIDEGIVDPAERTANEHMSQQYRDGIAGTDEFVRFYLQHYVPHPMEKLVAWRDKFLPARILPRISSAARELVAGHLGGSDTVAIITATNRFLTAPVARELGVEHLMATEPEIRDGRFTGETLGTPCFRGGKIEHLDQWLAGRGQHFRQFSETWFYSDSINDVALLGRSSHPVAVDPDPQLERYARDHHWQVLRLNTA